MLKSMTGYGKYEKKDGDKKIVIEMKSVNHRFLEVNIKAPKIVSPLETNIRSLIKDKIIRGKVDIFVSYEDSSQSNIAIKYNQDIARQYFQNISKMKCDLLYENIEMRQSNPDMDVRMIISDNVDCIRFSNLPGIFTTEDNVPENSDLLTFVSAAVLGAVDEFTKSREVEGISLKENILEKLDSLSKAVDEVEARAPQIVEEYRTKLMAKVTELLADRKADDVILATEVTAYADKICTDEEIVRLKAHIASMKDCLETGDDMGRKLDFIAQEMNREANTILSKSDDLRSSQTAIEMKTVIEKIREQVQNIE